MKSSCLETGLGRGLELGLAPGGSLCQRSAPLRLEGGKRIHRLLLVKQIGHAVANDRCSRRGAEAAMKDSADDWAHTKSMAKLWGRGQLLCPPALGFV